MAPDDGRVWAIAEAHEHEPMYWQDPDLSRTAWGPIETAYRFTDAERAEVEYLPVRVSGGAWVRVA